MNVINTLLPVFLIIALGAHLRRSGFITNEFVENVNRLLYRVGLPSLLFYKIATAQYEFQIAGKIFIVILFSMLSCIILAYIIAFILKISAEKTGSFVQGGYRANLIYVGLAIIIYSFSGVKANGSEPIETVALLVISMMVPVYNIIAVIVLLAGREKISKAVIFKVIKQITTNPLLLSCLFGILYSAFMPALPLVVVRTLSAIGQMALPLALLSVGAAIVQRKIAGHFKLALIASVIRTFFSPVVVYVVSIFVALTPDELRIAMILSACPAAVSSYVMADQLGCDSKLAASVIVISTILSFVSLTIVISLF